MSDICIVGEAWGQDEEALGHPFVGASGRELLNMLVEAEIVPAPPKRLWAPIEIREYWLTQTSVSLTNVFNLRPKPTNDISNLCGPKKEGAPGLPMLSQGKYIRPEYTDELARLNADLKRCAPTLIIAAGGTASWALLGSGSISKIRGTVTVSDDHSPCGFGATKVLPIYHPAAILRDWSLRAVTILDLLKAKRESLFRGVRRPIRKVFIEPDLSDMEWFYNKYLLPAARISFDIETAGNQITCIGFAPSDDCALVVPFVDPRREGRSYWPNPESEKQAWLFVKKVLALPCPKVGQNGIFDIHHLWEHYGISVINYSDDTMLLHHALHPESPKGLGFLGSVYTNEASWKLMARHGDTIKKEN